MLVAVVAGVATVLVNRARQHAVALAIDNENLASSERMSRLEATARLREARETVDLWLTAAADAMRYYPGVQEARKRLLQQAARDYEQFAKQSSDDVELETERGRINLRLGDVRRLLGEVTQAEQAYQSAISLFQGLVADHPESLDCRLEFANSNTRLGQMLADVGRQQEAKQAHSVAMATLRALLRSAPEDARLLDAVATSLVSHGALLADTAADREAEGMFREAAGLFEKLVRDHPAGGRPAGPDAVQGRPCDSPGFPRPDPRQAGQERRSPRRAGAGTRGTR